ncbi:MAG: hypothetical protein ACOYVJ_10890 [Nitrospirota bacterium]
MTLKPITLRLDEKEYERLRELLGKYGDPDLNVAYVIRKYIRDLNRALPYMMKSDFDLRNLLSFYGHGLKSLNRITEVELMAKGESKKTLRKAQQEEE